MLRLVIFRLFESYFRHRWLYLLPIVIMVGIGGYYLATAKPSYSARGILYVQNESYLASLTEVRETSGGWWISPSQATTNEIYDLIQTDAFVRAVIQQTDLEANMSQSRSSVDRLFSDTRQAFRFSPLGDNQVNITVSHENPRVTYQLVNAVIDVYLNWLNNAQRGEGIAAQDFFFDLIIDYEADLELASQAMKEYLEANPLPVRGDRPEIEQIEVNRLQSAIDLASVRYANALDKEENIRLSLAQIESDVLQSYQFIDAPRLPENPNVSIKQLAMNMGAFVVLGIILFIVAVIGGALLDRSFRFESDVTHLLDLPVLTIVPDVSVQKKWYQRFKRFHKNTHESSEKDNPVEPTYPPDTYPFEKSIIQNN